ncbi:FadR family transcriptional regulator [Streptomyces sp. NBC_01808]|uniref:FadR/GntR family transcriptional regulator n=1 Tax=Streptomyces sp. NBC_01808 TaxID=2975947 RepID=UPI002DDBBECC|nr:FadR/GntR family transcriptional regulator [Streptomyces sp. NBC_01808]WSA35977.1 FadR family transcriptional regulator [Streptomyces sp. NBC_01808]
MSVSPRSGVEIKLEVPSIPRRPARLAQLVVESLVDGIVSGAITPRAVLPSETALAQTFAVSRITVREAVKLLEAKGLVAVRHGVGAVVSSDTEWNLLDTDVLAAAMRHDENLTILDELIGVRISLESDLAALAAVNATDDDLAEIEGLFHRLESQVRAPEDFIRSDVEFHDRIMAASRNRLARSIVSTVHSKARTSERYRGHPGVADVTVTNGEHARVLERLLARDPDGASAAMADHIRSAWSRRRPAPAAPSPTESAE